MASKNHIHKYVLYKARSKNPGIHNKVFRCDDPRCTNIAPYELVIGKESICNDCGKPFILDRDACLRVRPRCINCAETKKAKAAQVARAFLDKTLNLDEPENDGMGMEEFDD